MKQKLRYCRHDVGVLWYVLESRIDGDFTLQASMRDDAANSKCVWRTMVVEGMFHDDQGQTQRQN